MGLHANEPGFYWKRGKEDCGSGDKVMGAGHYEGSPGTLAETECCCGVVLLAAPPHDLGLSITGCCYRKKGQPGLFQPDTPKFFQERKDKLC